MLVLGGGDGRSRRPLAQMPVILHRHMHMGLDPRAMDQEVDVSSCVALALENTGESTGLSK